MKDKNTALWGWFTLVLVLAFLTRAGLWQVYPLAESNDTPTYRHLANSLRNHGFERYNGTRTPGYPFFLMLTHADSVTYALQLTLGLCTTLLAFYIAWRLTHLAWFAGWIGLAHTLNLGQLFFEASLLTESLATFLLFLLLAGYLRLMEADQPPARIALGLTASALTMVRPLFAPLALWGAVFLVCFWRSAPQKTRWSAALLTTLPLILILAAWMNFIHVRFKIIGLDSIGGYHLVNHVSSFFERAPHEYASIRDTFLQFRAARIARTGSPVNTIWDAIPTLMEQEQRNYYALARILGTVSQRLIRENPALYGQNLALGWWWFWRVGTFWLPNTVTSAGLRAILTIVLAVERVALFGFNLAFLVGSPTLLWKKARARLSPPPFIWFAVGFIWLISILQTLAEHGDNARFLAPMQTLVVIVVGWGLTTFVPRNSS